MRSASARAGERGAREVELSIVGSATRSMEPPDSALSHGKRCRLTPGALGCQQKEVTRLPGRNPGAAPPESTLPHQARASVVGHTTKPRTA